MARQVPQARIQYPGINLTYEYTANQSDQITSALAAAAIGPEAADLASLESAQRAIEIAAANLAGKYGLPASEVQTCFVRLLAEGYCGAPPTGVQLIQEFLAGVLSMPRRALASLPPEPAMQFCNLESPVGFPDRAFVAQLLADRFTPLHTLDELAPLFEEFAAHQLANRAALIASGHPATVFVGAPWLDAALNKLYYTKVPITFGQPSTTPINLGATCMYNRRYLAQRRLTLPAMQQRMGLSANIAEVRGTVQPSNPAPRAVYTWGKGPPPFAKPCAYADASVLPGLGTANMRWIASAREAVFNLKQQVLVVLAAAAKAKDASQLWDACVNVMAALLRAQNARRLLRLDQRYVTYDILTGAIDTTGHAFEAGGFTSLLEVVGHVSKELTIGTLHQTRGILGPAPYAAEFPDGDVYIQLVTGAEAKRWRDAIALYMQLESQEAAFWLDFRRRLTTTLAERLDDEVRIPVMPAHRPVLGPLLNRDAVELAVKLDKGGLVAGMTTGPRPQDRVTKFPSPKGLRWENVKIEVISEDAVRITAGGQVRQSSYIELGFEDRRKRRRGVMPASSWTAFKDLASTNGQVQCSGRSEKDRLATSVKAIRKHLREVMNIDDNPFFSYNEERGYRPKFTLIGRPSDAP